MVAVRMAIESNVYVVILLGEKAQHDGIHEDHCNLFRVNCVGKVLILQLLRFNCLTIGSISNNSTVTK